MSNEETHTPMPFETPGFGLRISISIIVVFGWMIFLILWLLFFAENFNVYQNLAAIVVAILIGIAILAASWVSWGMKYGWKYMKNWDNCDQPAHSEWQGKKYYTKTHANEAVYGLGLIGALVYYVTTAPTFFDIVIGFFKSIFWPAFIVYGILKFLGL